MREPHNFMGLLTYLFIPVFMILIGLGLKRSPNNNPFSLQSIVFGAVSIFLVSILVTNSASEYIGLYQRMVESAFAIWIIFCAMAIKKPVDKN